MSENKPIQINEKIKIPQINLWFIWLILFVFPSILTIIGYNYYKEHYYYFTKTDIISKSFEDIKKYNELIVPENFLENQLNEVRNIDLEQIKKQSDKKNLYPEHLKHKIDNILCCESLFCIFYDRNADNIQIIQSKKYPKNIPQSIPTYLIKKHLGSLIKLQNESNKNIEQQNEYILNQNKLGIALQQTFKTGSNIILTQEKVSKNFSIIFDGELYFIFSKFNNPTDEYIGFFAIIKGSQFYFHRMLEKLHKTYPEIRLIYKEVDIKKVSEKPEILNSGIEKRKDGLFITAPTQEKFIRHVTHSGAADLNSKYGRLFPFIEYKVPINTINNYLSENEQKLKLVLIIILLLSGIYCLNISLFNFKESLSFKSKIMFLTLITAIFPFGIFYLGINTINSYNQFKKQISIEQHAELELEFTAQELKQYITHIEKTTAIKSIKLSELLSNKDLKPSVLLDYLSSIGDEIPVSFEYIFFLETPPNLQIISNDDRILKIFPDRTSNLATDNENETIFNLYPKYILKTAKDLNPKDRYRKDEIKLSIKTGEKIHNTVINDNLKNEGKMVILSQSNIPLWLISQYAYDLNSPDNQIMALFGTRFESRPILSYFFQKAAIAQKHFIEKKDDYEIKYLFLPNEKSGTASIWNGSGNTSISDEEKAICSKYNLSSTININENKKIIIKQNQLIPHIAAAIITKKVNNYYFEIIKLFLIIIAYLSLILYFSSKLLDIIFVQPVMLLASNAKAIANGGENWETEINSGDEFEDLNNNFKNLVTGLKERNILKSYVSEDAFSDIKGSSETNLKPGGEYIEATIVFSAIKDYDKLSQEITPQESIQLLSKFMSLAEKAAKKYGGSIDKIIGDTIMLVFRNNPTLPSHGLRAAQASLELVENAKANKLPNLYTGIASGKVISGKIGSYSGKLDFTVIGNPVNSAARFKAESKNGTEQTGIIISGTTIGLTKGRAKVKFLRRVAIKGKSRKYNIYELIGIRDK